jgi:hypothetical protein
MFIFNPLALKAQQNQLHKQKSKPKFVSPSPQTKSMLRRLSDLPGRLFGQKHENGHVVKGGMWAGAGKSKGGRVEDGYGQLEGALYANRNSWIMGNVAPETIQLLYMS